MAEAATKLPLRSAEKKGEEQTAELQAWRPFHSLRREVDRLFEDFDRDFWRPTFRRSAFDVGPFWRRELSWGGVPAVDIAEKDDAYEITADLPGVEEKDLEVKLSDGGLVIKGEKREEKEEKKGGYHLHERHTGSFERYFRMPENVDGDKIAASFNKGVLTVTLPKKPDAQKPVKRIEIRTA